MSLNPLDKLLGTICLECLKKKMGRVPDSLTWRFEICGECGEYHIATKTKHIPQIRREQRGTDNGLF